ncbi:mechanosensitive ion channel family protein [Alkaliphilus peptidifermentans]|uniref:Small conductance mechanosensitive channel n=1 Tax=Alkaliphilus peptidifermentans DSM 18978 TaxID=1120976 RepID=A0A1G5AVJ5_9FIRM|nr:mechanosensitive ion channel family protein [Alkaliphilus peptidifermentans]SCX81925.1 small conductance mechanosensitive channel [Alkaliphilus peptidifermentans DSM 18978]
MSVGVEKGWASEALDFLKNPEQLSVYISRLANIIIILLIARIAIRILQSLINKFFETRFFNANQEAKFKIDVPRLETLKGLTKSLVKYTIYFIAFTAILDSFGVEIGALIAAAGIGGLALGFGAQNLVRDIITGFFILFEDQFGVGNYVEIDGVGGIVEEMALRVTKIRGFNGDLYIIPNGEIKKVTNRSTGKMRAWVDISIAYEEDIDNAIKVLEEASEELRNNNPQILEGPIVLGVTNLGNSDVVISVMAKTVPMEQWATERLMRKTFKQAFDKEGIEIPYPRRVVINGDSK